MWSEPRVRRLARGSRRSPPADRLLTHLTARPARVRGRLTIQLGPLFDRDVVELIAAGVDLAGLDSPSRERNDADLDRNRRRETQMKSAGRETQMLSTTLRHGQGAAFSGGPIQT